MKNVLIVKTGAAGDVLRTTFVLETLTSKYNVYWLTDILCIPLINSSLATIVTDIKDLYNIEFDTIYSLEEDIELLKSVQTLNYNQLIGCYTVNNTVTYTAANEQWFDISLVSKYGIEEANKLKYENKLTFQELISGVFDIEWKGQRYNTLEYNTSTAIVSGNIAIAHTAGNKWPNKNWAYYNELKIELEKLGYIVNYLPNRTSIKDHIADIASHNLVICGDSLPMHIATALNIPSIALFTCTSPIEIYDYNLISKVVSPKLEQYYYQRVFDINCTESIGINDILKLINNA
jgi:heptosyltransferase-2